MKGSGAIGRVGLAAGVLALLPAAVMAGGPAGAASHPAVAAGTISTITGGPGGPDPATKVALNPCGVATGNASLYLGDGGVVHTVSQQTDWLTTPVGSSPRIVPGKPGGDGGPAAQAQLSGVCGVWADSAGNLLVVDTSGNQVRVVAHASGTFYGRPMQAGHIYRLAGTGLLGTTVNGRLAVQARLYKPQDVTTDTAGDPVIGTGDGHVYVVAEHTGAYYGQPMTAGHIYNVAGGGTSLGDGGPATEAELGDPAGVAVDSHGNLLITDLSNERVRMVAESNGTFYGVPMTAGDIYTVAGDGVPGYNGDGGPATSAEVYDPLGVAVDAAGNLVFNDHDNHRVRVVAATTGSFYGQSMTAGDIYTVAGGGDQPPEGAPATAAGIAAPLTLTVDGPGDLIFSTYTQTWLVAANSGTFYGQPMTAGDLYLIAGNGQKTSGIGGPATRAVIGVPTAEAGMPVGVAVGNAGDLAIAGSSTNQVLVTAGRTGSFYGQPMTAGHVYLVAGNGVLGSSGNGGPARKAELDGPDMVAMDKAGNLLILDEIRPQVRVVAASTGTFYGQSMKAGHIYLIAGNGRTGFTGDGGPATQARLDGPDGLTVDPAGNVVISDYGNNRVRVVAAGTGLFYGQPMIAGDIYTVAGGGTADESGVPATSATLPGPAGVAFDAAGNLVISRDTDGEIWVVAGQSGEFYQQPMTAGDIYQVAGGGPSLAEGVPATSASLNKPNGVAVDASGNLIIAETGNNRVRVVAESTGMFYGIAMTTGDIYTVAGRLTGGLAGDGGPGLNAELNSPYGVATDDGNIVIADTANNRVREVTG